MFMLKCYTYVELVKSIVLNQILLLLADNRATVAPVVRQFDRLYIDPHIQYIFVW